MLKSEKATISSYTAETDLKCMFYFKKAANVSLAAEFWVCHIFCMFPNQEEPVATIQYQLLKVNWSNKQILFDY